MTLFTRFFILVVLSFSTVLTHSAQTNGANGDDGKVSWGLTVVLMDGVDKYQQAEIPVEEATAFIEARTRLVFDVKYVTEFSSHELTPYAVGDDLDGDGKGDERAYLMMGWNLPKSVIRSLPVSSSYLFLYKLNGYRPLQAGSAVGLDFGIRTGGKPRPGSSGQGLPAPRLW